MKNFDDDGLKASHTRFAQGHIPLYAKLLLTSGSKRTREKQVINILFHIPIAHNTENIRLHIIIPSN
jgi:hypothetical protein